MVNVVALNGTLSRPASRRVLPSGTEVVTMEVTIRREGFPPDTVPVAWHNPPAWAGTLDEGVEVVVLGKVRRRFYRVSGITQSRTEVVADSVFGPKGRRAARRALVAASAEVESAAAAL